MNSNEQTLKKLRSLCLALPETSEAASWGHPNFRAGKKTFVTFERIKGRASIAFRLEEDEIARLMGRLKAAPTKTAKAGPTKKAHPEFFLTPYGRGQWVSMWTDGAVDWKAVTTLIDHSYRVVAIKRMLTALDAK